MSPATAEPAYRQIASALRRRIRDGSLRPGQRIPSTRRLAETWNVALATAAKALGLLAQQGFIFALPRVGNVVAGIPAREPGKSAIPGQLGRTAIVLAGIEMADREGLGALSMRGVAAKMGVPVTSLYRHVPSKEDLLRFMVDSVMKTESALPVRGGSWRARLEIGARAEWQLVRAHPWVARVMTLTRPIPAESSLRHAEWMLSALEETGVDEITMMRMHVTIYGFVQGLATNVETEAQAEGETGINEEEWMQKNDPEFTRLAATGVFPTFTRVLEKIPGGFELELTEIFEFGLTRLLDGFAKLASEVKKGQRAQKQKRRRGLSSSPAQP